MGDCFPSGTLLFYLDVNGAQGEDGLHQRKQLIIENLINQSFTTRVFENRLRLTC